MHEGPCTEQHSADARRSREVVLVWRTDAFAARGRRPRWSATPPRYLKPEGAKVSLAWTGVERRRVTRKKLGQTVMLFLPGEATITPCKMLNLSVLGACLTLKNASILSTNFRVSFDDFRTSFDCRLVWRQEDRAGITFVC